MELVRFKLLQSKKGMALHILSSLHIQQCTTYSDARMVFQNYFIVVQLQLSSFTPHHSQNVLKNLKNNVQGCVYMEQSCKKTYFPIC